MTKLFASRLHRLREKAGIPQKELAVALRVTSPTLSNYENGIYLPPLTKASMLAKELGTSLDYLCGLTDTNLDMGLLNSPVAPNLTYYQLAELLASFEPTERADLLTYSDFLRYKRQHRKYYGEPKIYRVAEKDT